MDLEPRDVQVLKAAGERVRVARVTRNWSQDTLAFKAGIKYQSQISDLERGRMSSRLVMYARIARALDMDLGDLLGGMDQA